jgi:hypothetical protein
VLNLPWAITKLKMEEVNFGQSLTVQRNYRCCVLVLKVSCLLKNKKTMNSKKDVKSIRGK